MAPTSAAWIVLLYAVAAGLWITLSDIVLAWLLADPMQRALADILMSWVLVAGTGALLYGLFSRLQRQQQRAHQAERAALQDKEHALRLLRSGETLYRNLFDAHPHPLWVVDRETLRFLAANDAAVEHYGYARETFLAMTIGDIQPPEGRPRLAQELERIRDDPAGTRRHSGNFVHRRRDGGQIDVEVASHDLDFEGRPARLVLAHDITQRHELERQKQGALESAQAAHAVLRNVLARIDDGFIALDLDWRFTYVNAQAARLLGRDNLDDLLGRHIWTEFPEGAGQPFQRAFEQAMAAQHSVVIEDHYAPWNRWFETRVFPSPEGLSIYFSDVTARRQAEQVTRERELLLQVSEQRYRLAAAQGHIWDWNLANGRFEIVPGSWQQLGFAPPPAGQELERIAELMHPDDRPVWQRALHDHLARGLPYDLEFRARHANGEWRWFHTRGQAVWNADGKATYMAGATFDISARKQAEQALRDRKERLRISELRFRLAAAGGQVWDWDVTTGRIDFPAPFWELLGITAPPADQLLARFESLMHPDDLPRQRRALREHVTKRTPYRLELRARHADGSWRWLHTQGQAVWGADGRATYMAGTTFDVTARKDAEDALHRAEAYRSRVFEQLADGVAMIDRDYRILDANAKMLEMLGRSHAELPQLSVRDVLPGFEQPRIHAELEEVIARRPDLAEWELLRSDGSQFTSEVSARPLGEGRFVLVVRDITLRRNAEKALLTYQLELSELTHRLLTQEQQTSRRVAQALHDHLGQTLGAARLHLDACVTTHATSMPLPLKEQAGRISALLEQAVREVRQVLADLRPPLLEVQGLAAALDSEIAERSGVVLSVDLLLEVADGVFGRRWPADVEYGAFMVAREAIANARQHAAASLVRVVLDGDDARLELDIIDDGQGIPAALRDGRPGHLGIVGMRERAIAIGAHFQVDDVPAGGTRVALRWQQR